MGDGKTHSMIALGLLAWDTTLRAEVVLDIAQNAPFADAKLVAIAASSSSNGLFGEKVRSSWAKKRLLSNSDRTEPLRQASAIGLISLGEEPTLILHELPPYFGYAITCMVGRVPWRK